MNFLRLLRLPGVFTALADILAGFFIIRLAGLDADRVGTLPYMLGVSACLYLAGMVWNDLFDVEEDACFRPGRPLPSGKVSMTTAYFTAIILSTAGLMLAMVGGLPAFFTASVLLLCILLYNSVLKKSSVLGPLSMGACRGLNLFLGMCAHSYVLLMTDDPRVFLPPLFLTAYTVAITVLSGQENDGQPLPAYEGISKSQALSTEIEPLPDAAQPPQDPEEGMRQSELRRKRDMQLLFSQNKIALHGPPSPFAAAGHSTGEVAPSSQTAATGQPPLADPLLLRSGALTLLAVPLCGAYIMASHWLGLLLFAALVLWIALPLYHALRDNTGLSVKKVVGAGIAGICLLDAAFVASVSQSPLSEESLLVCGVIAGLLLPANILRRYISVT